MWTEARARLDGLPGGGINIAHEAVDRHLAHGRGDRVALRHRAGDGSVRPLTYAELAELSARWAGVLDHLGVDPPGTVFTLLGRVPELHVTVLGALKHRNVACSLFTAFGPRPVTQRLRLGRGRVLVTTATLYRRRIEARRDELEHLDHVVIVGDPGPDGLPPGTLAFDDLLAAARPRFDIAPTDPDDPALLHFTSGTTGTPKGVLHVHGAVVAHEATAAHVLDLGPGDTYWCTADPGWVTGTVYGIVAPLVRGATSIIDEGDFDAGRWYDTIEEERVAVWYTAPTALRLLMRAGPDQAAARDLSSLRLVASVGEPLDPTTIAWARDHLGVAVHDTWWQTETGAIMIADPAGDPIHPGSMGRPVPGIEAALLHRRADGSIVVDPTGAPRLVTTPGTDGELALRVGWPSMFRAYVDEPERYARCFVGGWYRTGDIARRDADGRYRFVGRADDVITSAGHLIGPFEVESTLLEHPAVAQVAVVGAPDPVAGEVVVAHVVLAPGHHVDDEEAEDELALDLIGFARTRLGPGLAPRAITFDPDLPVNRSGKIVRRELRAREWEEPRR